MHGISYFVQHSDRIVNGIILKVHFSSWGNPVYHCWECSGTGCCSTTGSPQWSLFYFDCIRKQKMLTQISNLTITLKARPKENQFLQLFPFEVSTTSLNRATCWGPCIQTSEPVGDASLSLCSCSFMGLPQAAPRKGLKESAGLPFPFITRYSPFWYFHPDFSGFCYFILPFKTRFPALLSGLSCSLVLETSRSLSLKSCDTVWYYCCSSVSDLRHECFTRLWLICHIYEHSNNPFIALHASSSVFRRYTMYGSLLKLIKECGNTQEIYTQKLQRHHQGRNGS